MKCAPGYKYVNLSNICLLIWKNTAHLGLKRSWDSDIKVSIWMQFLIHNKLTNAWTGVVNCSCTNESEIMMYITLSCEAMGDINSKFYCLYPSLLSKILLDIMHLGPSHSLKWEKMYFWFTWKQFSMWVLTHWGRVTHICVGKLTIIGSDNGLSPERRQAIIWTNIGGTPHQPEYLF